MISVLPQRIFSLTAEATIRWLVGTKKEDICFIQMLAIHWPEVEWIDEDVHTENNV